MGRAAGRARREHLKLVVFITLISYAIMLASSFDLNEPAAEWEDEENNYQPQKPVVQKQVEVAPRKPQAAASGHPTAKTGRPSAEQAKKLEAMYAKVLKLFSLLKICDDEKFDIERVEIPEKWADQAKAMMVLIKVGKQKLIKRSDMARFKRIVGNCNQIDARVRAREEGSLSLLSQMSGMTDEDVEKFKRDQEENLLHDLRNRFKTNGQNEHQARQHARPEVRLTRPEPTTKAPSTQTSHGFHISDFEQPPQRDSGDTPPLIQFL